MARALPGRANQLNPDQDFRDDELTLGPADPRWLEHDRWALVAYVLSLSPATRPVLHLADFAAQRANSIGADGRVLPWSRSGGP